MIPTDPDFPDTTLGAAEAAAGEIWTCAWRAYSGYLADLLSAQRIDDLWIANSRFVMNSLDLFGQTAGEMQRRAGLRAPTLNDL